MLLHCGNIFRRDMRKAKCDHLALDKAQRFYAVDLLLLRQPQTRTFRRLYICECPGDYLVFILVLSLSEYLRKAYLRRMAVDKRVTFLHGEMSLSLYRTHISLRREMCISSADDIAVDSELFCQLIFRWQTLIGRDIVCLYVAHYLIGNLHRDIMRICTAHYILRHIYHPFQKNHLQTANSAAKHMPCGRISPDLQMDDGVFPSARSLFTVSTSAGSSDIFFITKCAPASRNLFFTSSVFAASSDSESAFISSR